MRLILLKLLFICCLSLTLLGCETLKNVFSSSDSDEKEYAGWDAKKFRSEAKSAADSGNYDKAIKLNEAIETRYPFGEGADQTLLDLAYAYYKNENHESAVATADRFIKLYPRSPQVDYAFYLKGLANYNRDLGIVDRFLPTDTSQRDQSRARIAYNSFAELVSRFPNSKYAYDSRLRMTELKNNMAMYEVHVARYYMKRKAYVAANNRASVVIANFQGTPAVPYALQVMQEAYTQLNMPDLAKDTARVYELNYPNGPPIPEHKSSTISHKIWDFIGLEK